MSKTTSFTRDYVDSLMEPGDYRDQTLPGFYIRVRLSKRTGQISRTYLVNGKVSQHRKNITVTIGTSSEFTPKQAAAKALEHLADMAKGINPNQTKQVQRDMAEAAASGRQTDRAKSQITLRVVLNEYLATRANNLKADTMKDYRLFLERVVPDWLDKPISKITSQMVLERTLEQSKKSPAQADYVNRILRALFNFAEHRYADMGLVKTNPTKIVSQTRAWNRPKPRQGIIRATDFSIWFRAVQELEDVTARDYLTLVVFTGLRKTEAESIKWTNVDIEARTFKVEDTKNRTDFTIPMSNTVYKIFKSREKLSEVSAFVFPGYGKTGHITDIRSHVETVTEKTNLDFTIHDLRRTFETVAESLDISHYTLKKLINHKSGNDVTAGYIITSPERLRQATDLIEKKMLELAKGKVEKTAAKHLRVV